MSTIAQVIQDRGIEEVVHFTTNHGVLGMLADGRLLSRERLPSNKYLEHVYQPNASFRKDPEWLDYISMSITRVNKRFFGFSRGWERETETWWAIVALDPKILTHDGVVFTTTNNIYPSCRRAAGCEGLEAMFADELAGLYGTPVKRSSQTPANWTTDDQAEALYPAELSTSYLRHVYTATYEHADIVAAQYEMLVAQGDASDTRTALPIHVRPDLF
jgi:ssDNA thymidine ADP-ribosyltransferase, DarT